MQRQHKQDEKCNQVNSRFSLYRLPPAEQMKLVISAGIIGEVISLDLPNALLWSAFSAYFFVRVEKQIKKIDASSEQRLHSRL